MAVVTLGTLWLNRAVDPSDRQSFPFLSALQYTSDRKGEVRRYTTGRLRAVVQVGRARTLVATLPACTRQQIDWLEARSGDVLCVRDDRGRKFWATFFNLPVEEHRYNQDGSLSLTLTEVTYSEAV